MNKRRTRTALILLIAAGLIVVFLIMKIKPAGSGEGDEAEADVAVHTGTIQTAILHRTVTAYGKVEPEPATAGRVPADSEVASPMAGIVARVECVEGQRVGRGAVLFRLDGRVAEGTLAKAKKALAFAEDNFERQKKLLAVEGTSQKSYLESEQQLNAARADWRAAETDLALLAVTAPLDGTIVKINSEPGEAVEANTVLAVIVDLERLVAAVRVPSAEGAGLKPGQIVRFEKSEAAGIVTYVGVQVDEATDTLPVRVSIPAGAGFRPGQFLSVRIISEERAGCLAVPEAAVIADAVGGGTGTIVLVQGDKAVRKPVKLGLREGGLVEVEGEGIKAGLAIVTEDAYAVPDGVKIHPAGR
ncbi:MAG: efflux RND transporter periplasmic adaptor subunit [Acidobacteriota bacterium]|nr:efflux RND transporter periplasmic adaptor subunit [Acidobacteriota bacterium]